MTFTAKYMNENLKKGWGTAQFSEALGISENEFTSLLEKTFSTATRSLKGFQRKLRQNDHFQKKRSKANSNIATLTQAGSESETETGTESEIETGTESEIETGTESEIETGTETAESEPNAGLSLEELENLRKNLSARLCQLEATVIAHRNTKRSAFDKLAEEEAWISKFLQQFNEHKKNAEEIVNAINTATDEIKQLQSDKKVLRGQLSQVEASIAQIQKITIFAVSQEDTVIESKSSIPEYDASYDLELFNMLINSELCEASTIKQIKYVASLIKYCHMLSDIKRTYEITFESSVSEKLFFEFL